MSDFLDRLGRRSPPWFGQLTLTVLLLCAAALAAFFVTHPGGLHPRGERTGPVGLLSWLPDAILLNVWVLRACGVVFGVTAVMWWSRWALPWSSWLCAASFYAVVSLYLESASQATHVGHLTIYLLFVHALWYHFYTPDIQEADRAGRFWTTPLYPGWVHFLGVFSIGVFYGWSGLSKWLESGRGWANGLSLQLWTELFGDKGSPWTRLILADRRMAAVLQAVTLVGETAGFVAIFSRWARPVIGLLLVGFHIGQIAVFGWGFHANMVMLLLFFLPVDRWLERLGERWVRDTSRTDCRMAGSAKAGVRD
jgi:hypothetical protein